MCEKTLFLTNSHTIHTSLTSSTSCVQPVAPGPAPCVQRTVRHIMGGGHRCCAPCCALVPATAMADGCTAAASPEAIVRRIFTLIVLALPKCCWVALVVQVVECNIMKAHCGDA